MIDHALLLLLFLAGFMGVAFKKNIVKKIFGLTILNNAVVILFVLGGSRIGDNAPIMVGDIASIVDPLPQALMLTAIVIGVCINALSLALAFRLYHVAGTFDIDKIRKRFRDEPA